MRILIVSELPIPSKRKSYRADPLSKYLSKMGYEVTVVCPQSLSITQKDLEDYRNITFSYIEPNEGAVHNPLRRFFMLTSMIRGIKRELERKRYDVIRAISFLPAYAAALANNKYKVPLIVNLSDFYSDLYKQFELPFASVVANIIRSMEKTIIRHSDVLIVDSPTQRRYWKYWGLEERRCVVLPNGVNRELFNPAIDKEKARLSLGIGRNKKVIFYHGDISRLDGLDVLIEAAPAIIKEIKDVVFLIVGDGSSYTNKLKNIVKRKGLESFFMFAGWIPHIYIPQYIATADVCVAPFRLTLTSNSNLMNKIIEYLAMVKPVVATRSSGLKEMLGDILTYTNPEEPYMLANVILQALNEPLSPHKALKMQNIAEKLDWREIVKHEEKIIRTLLDQAIQDFRILDYKLI